MRVVALAILAMAGTAPAFAQQKPTLAPSDYARWESIQATALSPDGEWFAHTIERVDQDGELRFRRVDDDSTVVVPFGGRPAFSPDGRWLAYSIGVAEKERERKQNANEPVRSRVGVRDLSTGDTRTIDDVSDFSFSGDGRFLALRGYAANGGNANGVDLIIHQLGTGLNTTFGNVTEHAWQDTGASLAMVIDAESSAGDGVRLYDAAGGVIRTLEMDTTGFRGLVWREDAPDLAFMRVLPDTAYEEPGHTVIAWRGLGGRRGSRMELDPADRPAFPAGHRIVEMRDLLWSEDGETLFLGTKEWQRKPAPDSATAADSTSSESEEEAGVEVWHAADVEIIPEQKVRVGLERARNYLAAWHLDDDAYVQLGNELTEDVTLSDGRYAAGLDRQPYERIRMFGPEYRDLYAIDTRTGERERFAERVQFQYGVSPGGRYMLYVRDGDYWTYDAHSGAHANLTADVPTTFVDLQDDHTVAEKPMFGTGGWTEDDRSVLLYDEYDIWEVRPDGSRAVNLTNGAADRVRHRRIWLRPEHRVVDMSKDVYVSLYGDRTKRSGFGRIRDGRVERLIFIDRSVTRLGMAEDADVYHYRVEGFADSPDHFVAGPRLDGVQVTNTNPFQDEYAWGRSELLDFTSQTGEQLQAALLYPADYVPGRTYPMIVWFYEITSNTVHSYSVPSAESAYNPAVFTQNGYFVLRPDIVYRDRNPGLSAVDALVPAVEQAIATGMVDRARVGIVGHSWGAYQTAFTITQTDMFAAAVAGAPLTNLISMYLSIYWNTGGTDARIFELSQGRMEVPFWEDTESYIANSPVFHIEDMDTPLLVAFGTEDGAVEFNQGVELYNAARRADKQMVMLVYEGENHSLGKEPNKRDYHRRIMEWFGHYLKGEPAPKWITEGERYRQ